MVVGEIARSFFDNTWKLFTQTKVPGLDVSFAAFLVALILIRLSISLFSFISGLGGGRNAGYGKASQAPKKSSKAMGEDEL